MKLMMHDQGAANPILQYFTPKMDGALGKVHSMTGLQLPLEQEQYANIVFVMGAMELLGGVLFTLNVKLGAVILVSGQHRLGSRESKQGWSATTGLPPTTRRTQTRPPAHRPQAVASAQRLTAPFGVCPLAADGRVVTHFVGDAQLLGVCALVAGTPNRVHELCQGK